MNPFGCGGMQFAANQSRASYYKVLLKRFAQLIFWIIAAPFIVVLFLPFALGGVCAVACIRHGTFWRASFLKKLLTVILFFIGFGLGLALDIIAVPLVVCLGVPGFVIFYIWARMKKRRDAARRLRDRISEQQNELII